jgi:hypothetical protein
VVEVVAHTTAAGTVAPTARPLSLDGYDVVLVGAGNSACAYVSELLAHRPGLRICLLERGSLPTRYGDELALAAWPNDTYDNEVIVPIASTHNVRCAQVVGGGGSVNYTLIHESDAWLMEHLGAPRGFDGWAEAKAHVATWLGVPTARRVPSPNVQQLLKTLQWPIHGSVDAGVVPSCHVDQAPIFRPIQTVFDAEGQRRHNGWNAVDWGKVTLLPEIEVTELVLVPGPDGVVCRGLKVHDRVSGAHVTWAVPATTEVVLAAQQQSVQLLRPHVELLPPGVGEHLGQQVGDHIVLPVFVSKALPVEGRPDPYAPLFHHSAMGMIHIFEWSLPEILRSLVSWSSTVTSEVGDDVFEYLLPRGQDRHVFMLWMINRYGAYDEDGVYRLEGPTPEQLKALQRWRAHCAAHAESSWWGRWLLDRLDDYALNTQFHTCGGCRQGQVVDADYRVFGTTNLSVADTSTCALPRTSPQMTAYLIGVQAARALLALC